MGRTGHGKRRDGWDWNETCPTSCRVDFGQFSIVFSNHRWKSQMPKLSQILKQGTSSIPFLQSQYTMSSLPRIDLSELLPHPSCDVRRNFLLCLPSSCLCCTELPRQSPRHSFGHGILFRFDRFEFSTSGRIPKYLPPNAKLVVGWYNKTLPAFIRSHLLNGGKEPRRTLLVSPAHTCTHSVKIISMKQFTWTSMRTV